MEEIGAKESNWGMRLIKRGLSEYSIVRKLRTSWWNPLATKAKRETWWVKMSIMSVRLKLEW